MTKYCRSCLADIDPDICGCGEEREGHDNHESFNNHGFIPMGCNCLRDVTAAYRKRRSALAETVRQIRWQLEGIGLISQREKLLSELHEMAAHAISDIEREEREREERADADAENQARLAATYPEDAF